MFSGGIERDQWHNMGRRSIFVMTNFQGKVIYSFDLFDFSISYHYFV